MILEMGMMGVFMGQFGWVANIVLPPVLLLTPLAKTSAVVRAISVGLALLLLVLTLNALAWSEIPTDHISNRVIRFRIGYYLWMAAMFGGAALALVSAFMAAKKPPPD